MKAVKLTPGNVWSGAGKGLAVFTNPTTLAKKKGNLHKDWPVNFRGKNYVDAEQAYQSWKMKVAKEELTSLMTNILFHKLTQHRVLKESIDVSGGIGFLKRCSHKVNGGWWEGVGFKSPFLKALADAYELINYNGLK